MSSFLGLDYVNPAAIDGIIEERLIRTFSGGAVPIRVGHIRWHVELGLEPRRFADASRRLAVHLAKHGQSVSFALVMPQIGPEVIADHVGQKITAAAAIGASSVTLTVNVNQQIDLPVGRFISFAGHTKVYQVDEDADVSLSNVGVVVSIIPPLQAAVANNERWNANPALTCRYDAGQGGWSLNSRSIVAPLLSVIEV